MTAEPVRDHEYPHRALKVAAELAGANVLQLCSEWRAPKALVHARWAVMLNCRKRGYSMPQIGRRLNRDHTTVLYGLRQADNQLERSADFRRMVELVDAA